MNTAVSGTAVKDEDDVSSNSATAVATQQSIKAFVTNLIAAQDLDIAPDSSTAQSIVLPSEVLIISGGSGIATSATRNIVKRFSLTLQTRALQAISFSGASHISHRH